MAILGGAILIILRRRQKPRFFCVYCKVPVSRLGALLSSQMRRGQETCAERGQQLRLGQATCAERRAPDLRLIRKAGHE